MSEHLVENNPGSQRSLTYLAKGTVRTKKRTKPYTCINLEHEKIVCKSFITKKTFFKFSNIFLIHQLEYLPAMCYNFEPTEALDLRKLIVNFSKLNDDVRSSVYMKKLQIQIKLKANKVSHISAKSLHCNSQIELLHTPSFFIVDEIINWSGSLCRFLSLFSKYTWAVFEKELRDQKLCKTNKQHALAI